MKKSFSANSLGLHRESAALPISESKSLSAQLLPQGAVTRKLRFLLLEILDHVLLVSVDPASEDQRQKLQRQSVHRSKFKLDKPENTGRNHRSRARLSYCIYAFF